MPRSAAAGNTELILMELDDDDVTTLRRICRSRLIPFASWQTQPDLLSTFAGLAVLSRAARLEIDEGYRRTGALEKAALDLGLEPNTVLSWVRRYRQRVREARICTLHRTDDAQLDTLQAGKLIEHERGVA